MVFLRRFGALAVVGALALIFAVAAHAQVTTGTIYGRVVDTTGAVLPGATVTVTNEGTNAVKTTTASSKGEFTVAFLPPGSYTVTVSLDGFRTRTETLLAIRSGVKLDLTYELEVGAMSEVVEVQSETPLLNSTSAQENVQMSTEMVSELPMLNRDITGIMNQGTGLATSGAELSINGMPTRGFTFTMDGVDASQDAEFSTMALYGNFNFIKGTTLEAVKEVEVSKNIFSAEIGMAVAGNVNIVSKSGTNTLHGSGFFQAQDGEWNSSDFISGEKTPGTYKGYGGSFGGPIIKDKLFFFGAYEGYRDAREERQSGNVPSNFARTTAGAANPATNSFWDLWPTATEPPADPLALEARFIGNFDREREDNHFIVRGDYNVSSNDYISVRYSRGRPNFLDPRLAVGNSRLFDGKADNFAATYTKVLNPTLTTELRFGYNKNRTERIDLMWVDQVPGIDVSGIPGTDGEALIKFGTAWSLENTWSMVKGRHSIKFGALGRFWKGSRFNEEMPSWEFFSFGDLLTNDAGKANYQFALEEFEINSLDWGVFVQDDLRLSPDLMLNLGIRWDYSGVPTERDQRYYNRAINQFGGANGPNPGVVQYRDPDHVYEAYYGMISPRVGFAWSMNEKTVIRGGFGVFFQPFNLFAGPVEIVQNKLGEPVEAEFTQEQLADFGIAYPAPSSEVRPLVTGSCDLTNYTCQQDEVYISDSSLDINRKNPYSLQWSLGFSRQLTDTIAWDLGYVGNAGERLTYSPENNRADRVTGQVPVFNFGFFRHYVQEDSSSYHSLQTSLRRRFQNGLGYGIHYTYASNLTFFRGEFTCCGNTEQPQEIPAGGGITPLANNRGMPPYYNRHRLFADAIWELPLGEGLLKDGWLIGMLFEVRSGNSLQINDRSSRAAGDRPDDLVDSAADHILGGWDSGGTGPWQYLDVDTFARVDRNSLGYQVRPGTLSRRAITGPGFWSVDFNLAKRFRFDRFSFQLRAEIFNAFNTLNYGDPQTRIERGNFGEITGAGGPRAWQLGVRFDF
jgi:opacity protein-like surface antigen